MLGFSGTKLVVASQLYSFGECKSSGFQEPGFKISGYQEPKAGSNGFSGTKNGLSGTNFGLSGTNLGFLGTNKRVIRNARYRVFKNRAFGFSGT
jgi:hypothetical protein